MCTSLLIPALLALLAVSASLPLEPTDEFAPRDGITLDPAYALFPRRPNGGRGSRVVLELSAECVRNETLKNMCSQCANVAKNSQETFNRCCGDRGKVREWCIDFINYIIH